MIKRRILMALCLVALASQDARAAEKSKKDAGTFIHLDAQAATLHQDGRHGLITVQAGLDVPDSALRERADQLQPRLRDAYVQVLLSYGGRLSPGTPPDVEYLIKQLQQATDRILGRPGARFLIGGLMVN